MKFKKLFIPIITLLVSSVGFTYAYYELNKVKTSEIELKVVGDIELKYINTYNTFTMADGNEDNLFMLEYKVKGKENAKFKVSNITCSNTTDELYKSLVVKANYNGQIFTYKPLLNPNYEQVFTDTLTTDYKYIWFEMYLDGNSEYCTDAYRTSNTCKVSIELSTI